MIIRVPLTILALLLVLNAPLAQAQARQANRNRQAAKQSAVSKETLALYEPGEYRGLKYRLMKPIDFDATKTYPLVLSLHGAGGKGNNNIKTLRNWNEYLADEALRRKHPCFVLAPQSAGSWNDPTSPFGAIPEFTPEAVAKWPASWQARAGRYRARGGVKPGGNLHIVFDLLDNKLSKDFPIDSDRIYCIGHSMGGAGTFTAIYQHPDRFAAAIPTAGGFAPWRDPARIKDVPIWTFHGSVDNVVPTAFTRWTFAKMKEVGGNMKYTELRGVAHGANAIAFKYMGDDPAKGYVTQYASDRPDKTADVWDWLFKHKLSERK